jgi:hypothetical protein
MTHHGHQHSRPSPDYRINPAARPGTHGPASLMPAGPLAIAVARGILPYTTADSNAAMAAKVAVHRQISPLRTRHR